MNPILKSVQNFWCEQSVTAVGLLVDGDDYYRAFYEAARSARKYILLAGWQFDADACLLRGSDAEGATLPVTLLKYLDALCERNPELRIYILAWDFHAVFFLEREWMQELRFNWTTNDRLAFLFDSNHAEQGSHHQKFVVIDGTLAFLGGLDLCDHRWDDRCHKDPNPLRLSRGEPHKPFHDVQAYIVGTEVAAKLNELFTCRWEAAGGEPLVLPEPGPELERYEPAGAVPLAASRVALSRTDPRGSPTRSENCHEICSLYLDAIAAARQLIYIETQYFSSRQVGAALAERLAASDATPLNVVLVLNMEAETLKEEIAVGLAQAKVIADLRKAVQGTRHRLGIYYTVPKTEGAAEPVRATYIHSKVMIVDDRFLTVGSANLTNRSVGVDTELNLSLETSDPGDALGQSIAQARRNLLAEHLGVSDDQALESADLVAALDDLARRREGRLRIHPSPTEHELTALAVIDPQGLPFDPAALEGHDQQRSIFVGGIGALWRHLTSGAPARARD
ncbi:MAG TPA: phospholipase D-like domain-containing protein [Polyangiaceae bacterium]